MTTVREVARQLASKAITVEEAVTQLTNITGTTTVVTSGSANDGFSRMVEDPDTPDDNNTVYLDVIRHAGFVTREEYSSLVFALR